MSSLSRAALRPLVVVLLVTLTIPLETLQPDPAAVAAAPAVTTTDVEAAAPATPGTYRSTSSATSTPITSLSVAKPSGTTTNDVLVAAVTGFAIGEYQPRVNTFARLYNCSTMFSLPSAWPRATKLFYNRVWILNQMAQRKRMYDCGRDGRDSVYYDMERNVTFGYPRTYVKARCDQLYYGHS